MGLLGKPETAHVVQTVLQGAYASKPCKTESLWKAIVVWRHIADFFKAYCTSWEQKNRNTAGRRHIGNWWITVMLQNRSSIFILSVFPKRLGLVIRVTSSALSHHSLIKIITNLYSEYEFLRDCGKLGEKDKAFFDRIGHGMENSDAAMSLNRLSEYLFRFPLL